MMLLTDSFMHGCDLDQPAADSVRVDDGILSSGSSSLARSRPSMQMSHCSSMHSPSRRLLETSASNSLAGNMQCWINDSILLFCCAVIDGILLFLAASAQR